MITIENKKTQFKVKEESDVQLVAISESTYKLVKNRYGSNDNINVDVQIVDLLMINSNLKVSAVTHEGTIYKNY